MDRVLKRRRYKITIHHGIVRKCFYLTNHAMRRNFASRKVRLRVQVQKYWYAIKSDLDDGRSLRLGKCSLDRDCQFRKFPCASLSFVEGMGEDFKPYGARRLPHNSILNPAKSKIFSIQVLSILCQKRLRHRHGSGKISLTMKTTPPGDPTAKRRMSSNAWPG